jgi:hypothetical protein
MTQKLSKKKFKNIGKYYNLINYFTVISHYITEIIISSFDMDRFKIDRNSFFYI